MTEPEQLPAQERFYGSLASMLRKYDRYARQDAFRGSTPEEFRQWREDTEAFCIPCWEHVKWNVVYKMLAEWRPSSQRRVSAGSTGGSRWNRRSG